MLSLVVLNFLLAVLLRRCNADGHFQNVALRKPCSQSSFYSYNVHECDAANNGNTTGVYIVGPNCIHTNISDWDPYWQVDLGQPYSVHHIVVWARDAARERMSDCQIKVDGNLCYSFGNVSANHTQRFDITFSRVCGSGRVIRVEKSTSLPQGVWSDQYSINMCEFEVYANYVCDDHYWGSECDKACGRCSSGQSCDKSTGHCPAGCAAGTVPMCTNFVDGNWGLWGPFGACSATCGGGSQTRRRSCDNPAPVNGGAGCSGASTDTVPCNTQGCPVDGQWGPWGQWDACSKTCGGGSQSRSRQCDNPAPANGGADCPGSGTDTQDCNTFPCSCSDGQYLSPHTNCTPCGPGCENSHCDFYTGVCTCSPGWLPAKCENKCGPGKYGMNCSQTCGVGCTDGICDPDNGHCDCQDGFQPGLCDTVCTKGRYGAGCVSSCAEGCNDTCRNTDGHCTCKPGWNGTLCEIDIRPAEALSSVPTAAIGGAAAGGVVAVAVVVVIVVVVVRKRRRNGSGTPVNNGHGIRKTTRRTLPQTSTENIYEDVTGLGPADEAEARAGAGASPAATSSPAVYENVGNPSSRTATYENVGRARHDASDNYESLDISTVGQRSVYAVLKKYQK